MALFGLLINSLLQSTVKAPGGLPSLDQGTIQLFPYCVVCFGNCFPGKASCEVMRLIYDKRLFNYGKRDLKGGETRLGGSKKVNNLHCMIRIFNAANII